jgi:hypothetical protein
MYKKIIATLALPLLLSACQTFPKATQTGQTNLVMTDVVSKTTGYGEMKRQFAFGEPVSAFLTLYTDLSKPPQIIEARWFNDGKLVTKKTINPNVKRQPHFVWFSINSSELGSGAGRVEIRADGKLLESQTFSVSQPMK